MKLRDMREGKNKERKTITRIGSKWERKRGRNYLGNGRKRRERTKRGVGRGEGEMKS